jgi:DNA-binding NarL/FixJ family response regulator
VISATIRGGATGYLLQDAPAEALANAVEHVRSRRRYMDRQATWISRLP